MKDLMLAKGIKEDVIINNAKAEILYVHRTAENREIYWLNSRTAENNEARISFRIQGKIPKRYDPLTGDIEPIGYTIKNGRTEIEMKFSPWDAFFIIFEGSTTATSLKIQEWKTVRSEKIEGSWSVSFEPNRSAPADPVIFDQLVSLTTKSEEGIKYFSGITNYRKEIEIKEIL